ncbi:hypothetical protein U1Q18_047857 [Sarracenia purpurea var. burkii]
MGIALSEWWLSNLGASSRRWDGGCGFGGSGYLAQQQVWLVPGGGVVAAGLGGLVSDGVGGGVLLWFWGSSSNVWS